MNISPNVHFPEVSDHGFSVSNIFSLWNGVIAFKLQLRAEDVDTKFKCQHKIQIFKANGFKVINASQSYVKYVKYVSEIIL